MWLSLRLEFFRLEKPMFLLTKYVKALKEKKMRGGDCYPRACSRGKINTFHLVRTVSPTHTEMRVFTVFVKKNLARKSFIVYLPSILFPLKYNKVYS